MTALTMTISFSASGQENGGVKIDVPERKVDPGETVRVYLWGRSLESLDGYSLTQGSRALGPGKLRQYPGQTEAKVINLDGETRLHNFDWPILNLLGVEAVGALYHLDGGIPAVVALPGESVSRYFRLSGNALAAAVDAPRLIGTVRATAARSPHCREWRWTVPAVVVAGLPAGLCPEDAATRDEEDIWFFLLRWGALIEDFSLALATVRVAGSDACGYLSSYEDFIFNPVRSLALLYRACANQSVTPEGTVPKIRDESDWNRDAVTGGQEHETPARLIQDGYPLLRFATGDLGLYYWGEGRYYCDADVSHGLAGQTAFWVCRLVQESPGYFSDDPDLFPDRVHFDVGRGYVWLAPTGRGKVGDMGGGPADDFEFAGLPSGQLALVSLRIGTEASPLAEVRINGSTVMTEVFDNPDDTPLVGSELLRVQSPGGVMTFDLAEFLWFQSALSDDDRDTIEAMLMDHYGLTPAYPAPIIRLDAGDITAPAGTALTTWADKLGQVADLYGDGSDADGGEHVRLAHLDTASLPPRAVALTASKTRGPADLSGLDLGDDTTCDSWSRLQLDIPPASVTGFTLAVVGTMAAAWEEGGIVGLQLRGRVGASQIVQLSSWVGRPTYLYPTDGVDSFGTEEATGISPIREAAHIAVWVCDLAKGVCRSYRDGALQHTVPMSGEVAACDLESLAIFAAAWVSGHDAPGTTRQSSYYLQEIQLIPAALSPAQRQNLEKELLTKWGVL